VGEIQKESGEGFAMKCDLFKDADLSNLIAQTTDRYGKLDLLVNKAGTVPSLRNPKR
jgi:NAD(P)-dependent dehydrogenase (short-subunit alcohol dehydrogenase family)